MLTYVYHGQRTEKVKQVLKYADIRVAMVLPGTTSKIESFDAGFNQEFKAIIGQHSIDYMGKNMKSFLNGSITPSDV